MKKTVLITGGMGYLGRNLAKALCKSGLSVRVYDIAADKGVFSGQDVEIVKGDVNRIGEADDAFSGVSCVVHLACGTFPRTSDRNPVADARDNLEGTIALLRAMKAHEIRKVVFASSGGTVYGIAKRLPVTEDHPLNPCNMHGAMKASAEMYIHAFQQSCGMDYSILRVGNIYGPFQHYAAAFGAVASFVSAAMKGETVDLWGDGSTVRDYIYIDDAVEAFKIAVLNSWREKTFNIGTGEGTTLAGLVKIIEELSGKTLPFKRLPADNVDVPVSVLDSSLFSKISGWKPSVRIEDGVKKILSLEYGVN